MLTVRMLQKNKSVFIYINRGSNRDVLEHLSLNVIFYTHTHRYWACSSKLVYKIEQYEMASCCLPPRPIDYGLQLGIYTVFRKWRATVTCKWPQSATLEIMYTCMWCSECSAYRHAQISPQMSPRSCGMPSAKASLTDRCVLLLNR